MNLESIASSTVYKKTSDTRFRNIGEEGIVVRQRASEVLVVSETGARILDLVDGNRTVDDLVATLAEEYEIDLGKLADDVAAYLLDLLGAGIIEPVGR